MLSSTAFKASGMSLEDGDRTANKELRRLNYFTTDTASCLGIILDTKAQRGREAKQNKTENSLSSYASL